MVKQTSLLIRAMFLCTLIGWQQLPTYKIGDSVADFRLKNVDNRMVALSSYPSAKGFILIFTSNHCPFAQAYEQRILALDKAFAVRGFPVIAINPNSSEEYKEDAFERMQERALEKNYSFPYLHDEHGKIAQLFGITRIPQAIILQRKGENTFVRYRGAIDDNTQDANGVGESYLVESVERLLTQKPLLVTQTRPAGCAVRY